MKCEIEWNTLSLQEWQAKFNKINAPNLLQSYEYSLAVSQLNNQKPRWGLIKIDGIEAGQVQILEAGILRNLLHGVIIDRGPVWFEGFGTEEHFEAFCECLNSEFPRRFGRKRRFIPEVKNSQNIQKILKKSHFIKVFEQNYETLCINLTNSEEKILKNVKKSWRNALNKAKKTKIKIKWDDKGDYLAHLTHNYMQDRIEKNYDGPSPQLINALAKTFMPHKNFLIGQALMNDKPIAAILILKHGKGATYQIGWSSALGRKNNAHHLLLWDALSMLKQRGVEIFDLGGINENTAKGVKRFKEGLAGKSNDNEKITLPGLYS